MKKCEVCGYENQDDSAYCMRCGKPLPESPEKVKEWFYVSDNKALGPVSASDLKTMIQDNEVSQNTYIWKKGLENWIHFYESDLFSYPEIKADEASAKEWFYIDDGDKKGPVMEEAVKAMVDADELSQQSLIWKVGLHTWIPFMDSELFELPSIPETMAEDAVWFYTQDQQVQGPVTSQQLQDLVMDGQVSDRSGVWTYGKNDWVPYNESEIFVIPELLDIREEKKTEPNEGDWYYTDGMDEYGPFEVDQIKEFYEMGVINEETMLWQDPDTKVMLKDLDFSKEADKEEPVSEPEEESVMEVKVDTEEPEPKAEPIVPKDIVDVKEEKKEKEPEPMILNLNDSTDWYIVENNESKGPFSESDCLDMYRQGRIDDRTYVWNDLLEDWIFYKDSELAAKRS